MVDHRNSLPVYLLGSLCLAILMWVTYQKLDRLQEESRILAQKGLATSGYDYISAETRDSRLVVQGFAVDAATAQAACDAAVGAIVGRIGLPGAFASVDCALIRYPAGSIGGVSTTNAKPLDATQANCQSRLDAAGKSGIIQFEKGKSVVSAGQSVLDRVAEAAKSCGDYQIEIGSHTDTGGPANLNQALSETRAAAVRQALIAKGVPANQVTAKGYGESQPLVNDFPDGKGDVPGQPDTPLRQRNRRIEFRIIADN